MAKAYFIGGAPRTSKTTLTLRFIKEKPILATPTDALRYTLRRLLTTIGAIASLVLLVLFWHPWLVLGIVINSVLLYGIHVGNWSFGL